MCANRSKRKSKWRTARTERVIETKEIDHRVARAECVSVKAFAECCDKDGGFVARLSHAQFSPDSRTAALNGCGQKRRRLALSRCAIKRRIMCEKRTRRFQQVPADECSAFTFTTQSSRRQWARKKSEKNRQFIGHGRLGRRRKLTSSPFDTWLLFFLV